jgi:hypothetical protein
MRSVRYGVIAILVLGLLAVSVVGFAAQVEPDDDLTFSSFYGEMVEPTATGEIVEMTDPRASGELSFVFPHDVGMESLELENAASVDFLGLKGSSSGVSWSPVSVRLVNENGAWSGIATLVQTEWGASPNSYLLTGSGDYEGLTMMLGIGGFEGEEYWGAIVPTDAIPPFPEQPAQ